MTDTELAEAINETKILDIEAGHKAADRILYEFLLSINFQKAAEAFNKLEKWYS